MHKSTFFQLLFLQTKCPNNSNQKGGNYIENSIFVNLKDTYTRVSKKPLGRKSPITTSGLSALQQRRNSNLDSRTPQECVVVVSDWLRQFQQDVPIEPPTPMEDSASEDTPSTSTSPASPQSQEHDEPIQGAASPDVESIRPPSVSSSVSAPLSPAASTYSQGGSSSTSQEDQPDVSSSLLKELVLFQSGGGGGGVFKKIRTGMLKVELKNFDHLYTSKSVILWPISIPFFCKITQFGANWVLF